jgi:hypothetical protein
MERTSQIYIYIKSMKGIENETEAGIQINKNANVPP